MEASVPKAPSIHFSLRRMFVVLTIVTVVVGLAVGGVRWIDSIAKHVERDAARQRVLEWGSDTAYDRQLLGAEVDRLKAEYLNRKNE